MANWEINTYHGPDEINNGKKYEVNDNLSLDALNNAIENSFFRHESEGTAVTSGGQFQSTWDATFADAEKTKSNNANYGAIVHQKEMEGYAQPLVKFEDCIDIKNLTYDTLKEYVDYFRQNYPKSFTVPIGASDSDYKFKTLVGVPIGFNYYGTCIITPIIGNESGDGSNQVFKLYAYESYSTEFAVGYIVANYPVTSGYVHFTGWEYPKNGQVEHIETIYDKDSTDATINQGLTSGVDFPNNDTANYVYNCTRSKYKGLYLLFSSYNDPAASLFVRVYVPNVADVSRFGLVTPYQGENTMLYWGHGMWYYNRVGLYHLRECYETTTTVNNSTRFKLVKVEGVLK